jgi:hypothetical protein
MMLDERNANHELSIGRAGRRCQACGAGGATLGVHPHPGERRGQAAPRGTIALCEPCRGVFRAYGKLDTPA